ncbi:nucleoside hydrolase-like domain-containing protein [Spirosoma panaciterrae]|uniref:nucleoside hydrolase-like domain-containing protein n=1 Tax=Spirosoma panaciterrae TaxID=496058 RepID=UPI0005940B77|nr:nucleoside hydrolase-like domain-containing protein [Spirosoma panaciterrae]
MSIEKMILAYWLVLVPLALRAQESVPTKPRILISTDIGGTDPDDNQSMTHFLMYSDRFETEGLVSSPSYGNGTKQNLLTMIDLYEKDLPKLRQHSQGYPLPDALRAVCKQGRRRAAPFRGYTLATEGSDWIIKCAKKPGKQPLWVLVWGGLDDVAQALHDDPSIQSKIKVYWIGGPNKKWSANSYAYIARNFPNLWFIEANGSYNGFFSNTGAPDSLNTQNYYGHYIREAGFLGKDFKNYYKGNPKMGDTPSLLYVMDGDPNDPYRESWGGSFEKFTHSPRTIFNRNTTLTDTVGVYSIMEIHIQGPEINIPADSACFTMTVQAQIGEQKWPGYYLGKGHYAIRYVPKQAEILTYTINSTIPGFSVQTGKFVVSNIWPGRQDTDDFRLGPNWFTDRRDPALFDGRQQGAKTVRKWRNAVLLDWANRWKWLL